MLHILNQHDPGSALMVHNLFALTGTLRSCSLTAGDEAIYAINSRTLVCSVHVRPCYKIRPNTNWKMLK